MAVQSTTDQPGLAYAHVVQFYQADEPRLVSSVARYLIEGLDHGDGILLIATERHRDQFMRELMRLGRAVDAAIGDRQLVVLDSETTLDQLLVDGEPDAATFEAVIGEAIRGVRQLPGARGLRAYGDVVGLLWSAGRYKTAVYLEELWNSMLGAVGFQLFCAYPIDVFSADLPVDAVQAVLQTHTHLMPTGGNGDMEHALDRALNEIVGPDAEDLTRGCAPAPAMPCAEATLISLRTERPADAGRVLARARHYYQSEKRFRALVENISDAISLLDRHGRVLYSSASTRNVLQYEPYQLTGREFLELVHPDDVARVREQLAEAVATPRAPLHAQFRARRGDGSWRWLESTFTNLLDDTEVKAIVSNYRDITDRRLAEERQRRDAEELARSYADLQAFAYAAAHDLKEPLRTVCAYTQLLVQRARLEGDNQEIANVIIDGVKRMSALLDDLLSLTTVNFTAAPERVELDGAAQQAVANLEQAIRDASAEIVAADLPAVRGNAIHLVTLFQNLLSNAIKYRGETPPQIRISAEQAGPVWIIKVADNGIGIAPEYRDQIFGLFKRLHTREVPGTGVGLAICKRIVEGMGGKIWVESEPGKGATFYFTAPVWLS